MPPEFETLTDAEVAKLRSLGTWPDERLAALDSARKRQQELTGMGMPPVATERIEEQQERREAPAGRGITDAIGTALNAALFNLGPDILEKVGPEGSAQRLQGSIERLGEEQPLLSGAASATGMLGGLPRMLGTPVARGASRLAGAAGRGAESLVARGTPGAGRQLLATGAARPVAETIVEAGTLGAAGAAEGAALGFGASFGEEPGTRREKAEEGAGFGLLAGGAVGAGLGGARSVKSLFDQPLDRALRIEQAFRARTGLPSRAATQESRLELRRAARRQFQEIEASTPTVPDEVADLIQNDPTLRRLIPRDSEEGRAIIRNLSEVDQATKRFTQSPMFGEVPFQQLISSTEVPERAAIPFKLAQNLEQNAKKLASARATGGRASALAIDEAEEAAGRLRDVLVRTVPGYEDAVRITAREKIGGRAFKAGERAAGRSVPPEQAAAFLARESNELGQQVLKGGLGPGGEAEELFRAGMAAKWLDSVLEGGSVREITRALEAPAQQGRLRIALGSDEAFQGFMREIRREQAQLTASKVVGTLIKFAAFVKLGSSLGGNAILAGLEQGN